MVRRPQKFHVQLVVTSFSAQLSREQVPGTKYWHSMFEVFFYALVPHHNGFTLNTCQVTLKRNTQFTVTCTENFCSYFSMKQLHSCGRVTQIFVALLERRSTVKCSENKAKKKKKRKNKRDKQKVASFGCRFIEGDTRSVDSHSSVKITHKRNVWREKTKSETEKWKQKVTKIWNFRWNNDRKSELSPNSEKSGRKLAPDIHIWTAFLEYFRANISAKRKRQRTATLKHRPNFRSFGRKNSLTFDFDVKLTKNILRNALQKQIQQQHISWGCVSLDGSGIKTQRVTN